MRTLALLLFLSATAFAQCTVDGTVVNSTNGAPIERAHISITAAGDTFFTDSDATGKWIFEHAPCENANLIVNRPGFLRTQQAIAKAAHDVRLKLAPQAVLSGRVLDYQGDPILGAQVSLMTSRVVNGLRGVQASTSAITNDLGEYRFSGLGAGKYILCANAGGGHIAANGESAYGEKCYPGSVPMDVAAGYEGRIDFMLSPIATVRVSGQVSGLGGKTATVSLVPATQIARMSLGLSASVQTDGRFTIKNVPPSSYTAFVMSDHGQATIPVEIGSADIHSLQLHFDPGSTVTGTVKIVSASERELPSDMDLELGRDVVAFSQAPVWNNDRTSFTISEVPAGNYRLKLTPPALFYVKSMTLGGRDISNSDLVFAQGMGNIEVVLADDGGAVEGDVSEPAWVLIQKDGVASYNARTDANGHFKIDNLPPGDYKVYAWDDNTNVEYGNPEWMRQNAKGVAVSVMPGQTAAVRVTRQTAPPI